MCPMLKGVEIKQGGKENLRGMCVLPRQVSNWQMGDEHRKKGVWGQGEFAADNSGQERVW